MRDVPNVGTGEGQRRRPDRTAACLVGQSLDVKVQGQIRPKAAHRLALAVSASFLKTSNGNQKKPLRLLDMVVTQEEPG